MLLSTSIFPFKLELRLEALYWCGVLFYTCIHHCDIDYSCAQFEGYIGPYIPLVTQDATSQITHSETYREFY